MEKHIVHGLHFKTTNGRSRFGSKVAEYFRKFIKLYNENPSWDKFLDDKGQGTVPMAYLVAIEEGFRAMGPDKHTMGSKAITTLSKWGRVDFWRKREAYIALVRFLRNATAYKKWEFFLWLHYIQRLVMGETFKVRHSKLFCAEHFKGQLEDPEHWHEETPNSPVVKPVVTTVTPASAAAGSPVPMRFDIAKGRLVPY